MNYTTLPPNTNTPLLTTTSKQPRTCLLSSLIVATCISLASAFAFAFLLLSSSPLRAASVPSTTHNSPITTKPFARPFKKLSRPAVILISCDGFRFGYQFKTHTPNMHCLIRGGTEAELGLVPVFPSLTFPNHYAIATGLYPPYHGIVNNYFFDPVTGEKFTTAHHEPKWWLGEPIWETAVNQGRNAAVLYWAGGEVKKGSWTCPPQFCPEFSKTVPFEERVDTVLGYFDLPSSEIPDITALYLPDPDSQGHVWGPDHPEITKAIAHVDKTIGRLIEGLKKREIFDDVTIIMLGDHGMVSVCDKKYIFLEDLAPWIEIPDTWVQSQYQLLAIQPPANVSAEQVVAKMREGLSSGKVSNGDKVQVYLKEDLPSRLHYSASDRIPAVIGLVAEGYSVEVSRSQGGQCVGAHGYDNELFSMRSIFIGHGPQFEAGRKVASFVNVEVYNMITSILKLKGAPNNGSVSFADSVLLPSF